MQFQFQPTPIDELPETGHPGFRIERLWRLEGERPTDISLIMDRSYPYSSLRELRWHLADRFACPVERVQVNLA